jgi:hypothetical protein
VQGVTAVCSFFSAYSLHDWIVVETEGTDVFLTVAPNPVSSPRTGTIVIAGSKQQITQLGRSSMLANGTFDSGISPWGWNEFPNSKGSARWSSLDASGSPLSGSILLRDTSLGDQAFQQMQCVNAAPGVYEYGFTVRSEIPEVTQAAIAFINFTGPNCTGTFPAYPVRSVRPDVAGVWEAHEYIGKLTTPHQSIMIVIAGFARTAGATQEVWIDDVFLRPLE